MADSHPEVAPLLGGSERPASRHSTESHEHTPLLSRTDDTPRYDATKDDADRHRISSLAATALQSIQDGHAASIKSTKGVRRWPTLIAIGVLALFTIGIITGAFFLPAAIEEYAKQSFVIEPTNLSIHNFTSTGVTVQIQAIFKMDASRVENDAVRRVGRFGTLVVREVETEPSIFEVYLPEYGNVLVGTAAVPRIAVDIRDGHHTTLDFPAVLEPGNAADILRIANDWLEGRLDKIRVLGKANVGLKSGIFPLGTQTITESLVFEGGDIPAVPEYNITGLFIREVSRGMAVNASLSLANKYPVKFTIPPLRFDILVPNCGIDEPYIRLADATTDTINVEPRSDVAVYVGGVVQELPESLIQACPDSHSSPLDLLLGDYLHGNDTTVFVQGSSTPSPDTPEWIAALMASITVPVPFPGRTFDKLVKNFSLTDTHFTLPSPFSDPDETDPTISGTIVVTAAIPQEMNFSINITRVRATADVYYKGEKLGILNLKKWQPAESVRQEPRDGENATLKIQSKIKDAPLHITDEDVFSDVLRAYLLGGTQIMLKIVARVDAEVSTVLGELIIKDVPAEGAVPLKPVSRDIGFGLLKPAVGDLKVRSTSNTSVNLQARINFTNPTEYTALVPYFNIHILNNGSIIGDATARDVHVTTANNFNILVEATWDPSYFGGEKSVKISRELLSQYISGFNTTLTFQMHENSIPNQPGLGKALSEFAITIPTPKISAPGNGDGDNDNDEDDHKTHFIDDATFHLLSSTAQFTLHSPFQHTTMYIDTINATAFYNHTEPVGKIDYDLPIKVPPGSSKTPKLPVDWSVESIGYESLKNALGGTLKLDAKGSVRVRIGQCSETVWYIGSGIGATVTL